MKHSIRSAALAGPAFLLWSFLVTTGEARAQVPADDCALLGPANEYPVADPCVPVPMNTNGMSPSFNPGGCGATNGDDAWAWFTATTEQTEVTYTVTGCAGLLCGIFTVPVLHVFSGADCDSLELASCALGTLGIGGTATVTINTEVGDPYWVRVQRIVFNDDMEGTLCIRPLTVAPVNDDCANAIPVGNGTHPFTSLGATGSYISSCAWSDTSDVWFSYTATCADQLRVTTCDDADFDTTVSIFDACGGTELVCHDDHYGCANYTSTAILNNVVPGQTYLIRIAGFEGATGTGNVTITCGPPPPPADNDDCANAVPIGDGIHPFNVESATGTMVSSCSWMDHNDVWFEYTASCTGLAMVSTCGTAYFNTTLSVFDACEGNELACSDNFPDCLFFTSATSFSTVEGHTYMVRVAGFNGDQGNGEIVIACSPVTWYSQASGNATDPIWSHMPVGPPDHAIFSHTMNVVVQDGHDVVQDTSMLHAMQFIVEDGAAWTMGEGHVLSLSANYMGHGTVNTDGSTVALDGEAAQIIMGTGTLGFHDLEMNNPATAIAQADMDIRGTLQLNAGTFNANGRTITLVSDAQGSARLGPVAAGASYTGDLTVQRWVPGGVTNWRLLGSPVAGATINDWKDDFFTAGFPGSHFPPFYDPPTSTDLWPSIRWYDETDPGTDWMDGLTGVAAHTTPLTMGQGFAAWSGDNLAGTAPFTLDLSGPPHIATAPIALPMSWTDTGVPATDGWNLVSNPLPGPVLFSQLDRGTDVDNAYQLFDPVSGNFATWNGTVGTLGATDTIQSFQGFFLKANGPAHAVTVSETAKVLAPTGGHFGGQLSVGPPALRLQVASGMNAFRDEALVMFSDGQPGFDAAEGDVLRIPFAHPQAPSIATKAADGGALTINMHGEPQGGLLIPVMLHTGLSGTYTITATGTEGINGLSCLVLED
ncbi:MAG: hypothetical protein RBT71_11335, partial [Flavobacteriales bacterium]|nr:hypothetical protein [Flavobacteriales bacterium]